MLLKLVYTLLTIIFFSDISFSQTCFFQEGQSYEVFAHLNISNRIKTIFWMSKNDIPMSECWVCGCGIGTFNVSATCLNGYIEKSSLVIDNQNRNKVENYFPISIDAPGTVFFTVCQKALIYVSPENNSCNPPVLSNDGKNVNVFCSTTKTYPAAGCIINIHNRNYTNTMCTSKSYTISGNEYMTTTCSFVTQVGGLQLGTNVFSAYLYPNLINGTQFAVRANDVSIDFVLPLAALVKCRNDSMDYIKLGETYSCECTNSTPGNIPAKFQWYDEKNQTLDIGVLTGLANISGLASKVFKCQPQYTWSNTLSGASITFVAKFSYGPTNATIERKDVSSQNDVYNLCPNSGNITLVCHVVKATVNPEPSITMYHNNLPLSFSTQHNSSSYNYISSFQPRSAGVLVFGCLAENSKFSEINVNTSLQVLVRVPPATKPFLTIDEASYDNNNKIVLEENKTVNVTCNVVEGENIVIKCGQFSSGPSNISAKLSLQSISRTLNNQNCTCTAGHITGCYMNNMTWFILNVTYNVNITQFKANNETEKLEVDLNSTVDLACTTDGNPMPWYSITRESGHAATILEEHNFTAKYRDSGVYKCSASNDNLYKAEQSVFVYVKCSAELVNSTDGYKTYSFKYGDMAKIEVSVFGYPFPNLTEVQFQPSTSDDSFVHSISNQTNSTDEFSVEYEHYKGITTILYTIKNVTNTYFANYTMIITNSEGTLRYYFKIVEKKGMILNTNEDLPAAIGGAIGAVTLLAGVILAIYWLRKEDFETSHCNGAYETEISNLDVYSFDLNVQLHEINGKKGVFTNDPKLKDYKTIVTTLTTAAARPNNMTSEAAGDETYGNFT